MLEDKAKEKENREGRTMGAAREQSDGAFKPIRDSQSSFLEWGRGAFPWVPQSPRALGGQGSKERDGTMWCLQIGLTAFACRDSDTQCDGRNSDISPFRSVFLFH